jgi:hypothetical protein
VTSTDQNQVAPNQVALQIGLKSPQWRSFYANSFTFNLTPFDCNVTFQSPVNVGPGRLALQEEMTVYLTISSLKVLYLHVKSMLEAYENELGPVQVTTAAKPTEQNSEQVRDMLRSTPISA